MKISQTAIGMAVRAARQAARMSLSELSKISGINLSALSRIETGQRSLDLQEASELASALKINVQYFLDLAFSYEERGLSEEFLKNRALLAELRHAQQAAILTAIDMAAD